MNFLDINGVKIEKTAGLSPMASVADRAYRLMCKKHGASYLVSEMVSAKGLCYSGKKTENLCVVTEPERPYAIQLFGEEAQFMGRATELLNDYKYGLSRAEGRQSRRRLSTDEDPRSGI